MELIDLTGQENIGLVASGDTAIEVVTRLFKKILIPAEGGWLAYPKIAAGEVACKSGRIVLEDLKSKLSEGYDALLYQNPGGYFAEQPMEEIYALCKEVGCKVLMDVSGGIGTKLCDSRYADIMVGSFGRWKLVDVGAGGFFSCMDKKMFDLVKFQEFEIPGLQDKLAGLSGRIKFLRDRRKKVISDLKGFDVVRPDDLGFVVIVQGREEEVIAYCTREGLEWTKCPRYIRLNSPAISIEVKRLESKSI
jgi:hypothetical protein